MKLRRRDWTIVRASWAMPVAKVISPLASMGGMLGIFLAAAISWFLSNRSGYGEGGVRLSAAEAPMALGLLIVCMLVHELMHLAAFAWAGGKEGSIVAGLRLGVVPGFSAVMKVKPNQLNHKQWAMVSVAGPFVTGCIAVLLYSAFGDVHWIRMATLMTLCSSIFNLLPFRNSDGYHLIQSIKSIKAQPR